MKQLMTQRKTMRSQRGAAPILRATVLVLALGAASSIIAGAQLPAGDSAHDSPRGWFGVTVSDNGLIDERGNASLIGYPRVTSVERGSPAEVSGVRPGDILISFNSRDLKGNSIADALRDQLQPGTNFTVRLRRGDATREVRGVIAPRPPGFDARVVLIWRGRGPGQELGIAPSLGSVTPPSIEAEVRARRSGATRLPPPMPVGLPPVLLPMFAYGEGVYPFAGAEFTVLNPDLAKALGVKREGVLVTNVEPGSPATLAGLRGGDVVLTADSIRLESPIALVRAIRDAGDRSIRLGIIRNRKPKTLMLRW